MTPVPVRRRRWRWVLAGAAAILVGAGCGGGGAGSDATPTTGGTSPTVTQPDSPDAATDSTSSATTLPDIPPPGSSPGTVPPTTIPLPAVAPLPTPELIPLDDESPEPVVPLGSITIPVIGIDRPMFEGIRLPTFDMGPGHWPGTAMPGQVGNVVIGGHRTSGNADFADLDLLQPGNEVIITDSSGARFTYLVDRTEIIDPFSAVIVGQTPARTATLFACHPKGSTDQRIVVRLTLAA